MKTLNEYISQKSFPCIMAKAVAKQGLITQHEEDDILNDDALLRTRDKIYEFIERYRMNRERMHSFVVSLRSQKYKTFEKFEETFWTFLKRLNYVDKEFYPHDERVSALPDDNNFSYSLKSEAFFILALHPQSPRLARRFYLPSIVFNPHEQFEKLRQKKMYTKIKNIIRKKDAFLQGKHNSMLSDFGERTEVFQYLGKSYNLDDPNPLII